MNIIIKKVVKLEIEQAFKRLNGKSVQIKVVSAAGNVLLDTSVSSVQELEKLIAPVKKKIRPGVKYKVELNADDAKAKELMQKFGKHFFTGEEITDALKVYA